MNEMRKAIRVNGYIISSRSFIKNSVLGIVLDANKEAIYEVIEKYDRWAVEKCIRWLMDNELINEEDTVEKGQMQVK